jgi:hypothetical protein
MKLGVALSLALSLALIGCRPAQDPRVEQSHAAVLYAAVAVRTANDACVTAAGRMRDEANAMESQSARLVRLQQAKLLNGQCEQAARAGRDALEGAEKTIAAGGLVAMSKIGCALHEGLGAAISIQAAMKTFGYTAPRIVDDAVRFGSPIISVTGACEMPRSGAR